MKETVLSLYDSHRPDPSRRQILIETAIRLFSRHGFHATGIDTILAEVGISKKTLYVYFRSKEELILAALKHQDGVFRNAFMSRIEARAREPAQRLLAAFDVARDWFSEKTYFGCMFISAAGEYADRESAIHRACEEFKRLMRDYLCGLCRAAGIVEPDALADELALLLEGAIVVANIRGEPSAADTAKRAAKSLIEQRLGRTLD